MAISVEPSNSYDPSGIQTSGTFTLDCGSGSDRCAYAAFAIDSNIDIDPTPTVDVGGTSMAQVATTFTASTGRSMKVMRCVAPSTGSQTVTWSCPDGNQVLVIVAVALSGVDQTTPEAAVGTAVSQNSGASIQCSVNADADDYVLGFLAVNNILSSNVTDDGSQTRHAYDPTTGSTNVNAIISGKAGAGGSTTVGWSYATQAASAIAIAVNAAASGSSIPVLAGHYSRMRNR